MSDYEDIEFSVKKLREEFENFKALNAYPKSLATEGERMATARVAVLLADFRNKIGDLGEEADFNLYANIASDHDDTAIPLYLMLVTRPDRAVMVWAEEFAKSYLKACGDKPADDTDFVLETCRSFYDPIGYTDPEDLEELMNEDGEDEWVTA